LARLQFVQRYRVGLWHWSGGASSIASGIRRSARRYKASRCALRDRRAREVILEIKSVAAVLQQVLAVQQTTARRTSRPRSPC